MPVVQVPDDWTKPVTEATVWTEVVASEAAIGEWERAHPGMVKVDPEYRAQAARKAAEMRLAQAEADLAAHQAQVKAAREAAVKAGLKVAKEVRE